MSALRRRIIAALIVVGCGIIGGRAEPAGLNCALANTPTARTICSDPVLLRLDRELQRRFDALLAVSLDPAPRRAGQRDWLETTRDKSTAIDALKQLYRRRLDELGVLLARMREFAADRTVSEADARLHCLPLPSDADEGEKCTVKRFGSIGSSGGHHFDFAQYAYTAGGDGALDQNAIVIFERLGHGRVRAVIAPDGDPGDFFYGPRIMRAGNRTVLHIPGSESGTGNLNIERLFLWRAGRWRDVDTSTWLGDLARRLPARSARKGIYPDYPTMTAWTPLWVAGDGNSCPTGGRARLRLGWRGARIVLRSVHLERAAGCGEPAA